MPSGLTPSAPRFSAADSITDPRALEAISKSDTPKAIRAASREFESLFMHQLFKSMRATISKDEGSLSEAGMGGEMFTDMLDMEYAKTASENGGIGLADLVAEQFGVAGESGAEGQRAAHLPRGASPAVASASAVSRALRAYGSHSATGAMALPVQGGVVSSEFGLRQLADDAAPRMHEGLDIAAPTGTPIHAASGGTVAHAGWIKGYGKSVIVDHGNGTTTLYGHASELLVAPGDRVERGMEIAKVGSTGHSTGPHVHFEVRHEGRAVDPRPSLGKH